MARRVDLARAGVAVVMVLSLLVVIRCSSQARPESRPEGVVSYRIDVNTADASELMLLPGIGPSKADAIVAYRRVNGPFHSPSDLTGVHGIAETIVRRISPHITCGPPKPVNAAAGRPTAP